MKYQLVLQLAGASIEDYDRMVELEQAIAERLGSLGKVDGHDAGSGEMNIFILTDTPTLAFERIAFSRQVKDRASDLKVAYREIGKDSFTIIHPLGLSHFAIT